LILIGNLPGLLTGKVYNLCVFDSLLKTKLFRPALWPSLVNRSALINRFNVGLGDARLMLVSVPAGFGKTTLADIPRRRLYFYVAAEGPKE